MTTEITVEKTEERDGQGRFQGLRRGLGQTPSGVSGAMARVPGIADSARCQVSSVIGHVPEIASRARFHAGQVAERLPGTVERAQSGAQSTVTRLQTMPDSRLGLLAAASLGFGAGLRLAGSPRLAALVGFAPASIFGFAIASRPSRTRLAPNQVRP